MARVQALGIIRRLVLKHASIPVDASSSQAARPSGALTFLRGFAESSYLNKDDVTQRVLNVVKNFDKIDPSKVTPEAKYQQDLGLDSLDQVELVMAIEEEFAIEIPDSEADKILSNADAISYVAAHPQAK